MKVCSTLKFGLIVLLFASVAQAQSIDISKFYYRDYLDFGQNKGAFSGNGSTTITGKDGTKFTIPQTPNFSASSNNGNLAAVGRGFAVTANHVVNFTPEYDKLGTYRTFDLSTYKIADTSGGSGISKPYGRDEKFTRFDKYVVEGQVDMLDFENSIDNKDTTKENANIANFKNLFNNLAKDSEGNVYLYQAGSGIITLRGDTNTNINRIENGETKGGGFGTLVQSSVTYESLVLPSEFCNSETQNCSVRGIMFKYASNLDFNNRITSGDSGSGIYAYDNTNKKWVLLGVVSQSTGTETNAGNVANIAAVSNKDLQDYQKQFEQKIDLKMTEPNTIEWILSNTTLEYGARGDTPKKTYTLEANKDLIFSGGGNIQVTGNIYRNVSGQAGGFVFTATNSATKDNPTKYIFTNKDDKANIFIGSGLDIGEKVKVEWALGTQKGDSLHKIGKGELVITTQNNTSENLGTLKIGEGKVTLNTDKKAFDNIYITSGRGELALVSGKAQALGATKNANSASSTTLANSYTLAQESTDKMGFYFGKGGGKFDLAGNSLVLNTIAANDSKAIITNSDTGQAVDLEIEGLGYENNKKTSTKADTIIHASIGDNTSTNGTNLNLIYKGDKTPTNRHSERSEESISTNSVDSSLSTKAQNDSTASNTTQTTKALQGSGASLIFDGHINIKGKLEATNGNIVLQGHPTTHATISDEKIREQIKKAESGTSAAMPDYMDLSKPSTLNQPDWDSRNFNIKQGITLTNATLTVGKAANLTADITADSTSQINFGGKHFIDSKDGKNVIGSGFSYQQGVTSDELKDESYKDSSYSGTITASGTKITSQFFDFAPNLTLTNGASLNATNLTLNTNSNLNLSGNSTAEVGNLIFKGFTNNDFASKFKLNDTSTFSVTQALSFDKSTFDLSNLSNTKTGLTLPTEYNLYAFNNSKITATNFTNSNANAEFVLDNSTFKATSVSFQSAKIGVQNGAEFKADSLKFDAKSTIDLTNSAKFTLTNGLQAQDLNLNLSNSSTMSANSLTSKGASTINLNDKATLTLTDILTSKDLTLTLKNESKFTAQTLTASGVVNLKGDENGTLTLDTLNLNNGNATLNANGSIANLNLNNVKETAIGENVSITTLNLTDSTAKLDTLGKIQKVDLKNSSNLHFNELNLNEFKANLTSDETSQAHIKKLIYDAKSTQANGISKIPQSNLSVSELFKLDNVGKNLGTTTGTTQGAQNAEKEKLEKDLLTLEFSKNLELKDGANLDISFADKVTKDNQNLIFNKDYTIFTAKNLLYNDNFNNITFKLAGSGTDFFVKGRLDKNNNAFFVQFVRENPRNFSNLNPHIKNPAHSPLLEILLQHNKNDTSIDKAVNMSDYTALNQRLAQIDTSLKTIANADSAALKTLPLLQKQEINARIQQNRFTTAKFALAKITNPAQKSDIVPTLLYLDENERQNRVWSGASASFFSNDSDKFSLQSVSIGYDRKLFGDEFLLGILASLTNTQLSSNELSLNPKIYTLALYSDALFRHGELQNELSFSLLNGDKGFESENGSYKSFYGFLRVCIRCKLPFYRKV